MKLNIDPELFQYFPKIGQPHNTVYYMKTHNIPRLSFTGTIKLHGSSAGIGYNLTTDSFFVQSRERILSPNVSGENTVRDLKGLAYYLTSLDPDLSFLKEYATTEHPTVMLYGEWCGGTVQRSNIAIRNLPKQFVTFGFSRQRFRGDDPDFIDGQDRYDRQWISLDAISDTSPFRLITSYPTYEVTLDMSCPEEAQDTLRELTDEVARECPFAKAQGVSGIGEGIVWRPSDYTNNK